MHICGSGGAQGTFLYTPIIIHHAHAGSGPWKKLLVITELETTFPEAYDEYTVCMN